MPFIPIKHLTDVYTLKDVAELLSINAKTLHSRIQSRKFPEPTYWPVGARRPYYTKEDVKQIMLAYGKEVVE